MNLSRVQRCNRSGGQRHDAGRPLLVRRGEIRLDSGNQRTLSGNFSYLAGEFYDGRRMNIAASSRGNRRAIEF